MLNLTRLKFTLSILLILAGCTNNSQKQASTGKITIYKIWQFKTIDTSIFHSKTHNFAWIGNNILDLTNKDTLKFSYRSVHNKASTYPYKIKHDTIFIQNKPGYKILKLTAYELHLLVAFKTNQIKNPKTDSTVMIYRTK